MKALCNPISFTSFISASFSTKYELTHLLPLLASVLASKYNWMETEEKHEYREARFVSSKDRPHITFRCYNLWSV